MRPSNIADYLSGNTYPGRGILLGRSPDGRKAVIGYFIMGRSVNSRNRVFTATEDGIRTEAHDPSKMEDPSLIIYHPVRVLEGTTIVTNGDQTDTIRDSLASGHCFRHALLTREFEPDGPNFTPRISCAVELGTPEFGYKMSILKSIDPEGSACARHTYEFPSRPGLGHFIHTYICDGNPIPTFCGEPERVCIPDSIDAFTTEIWDALDKDNKISLYVRCTDPVTGEYEERLVNKNK